jgi:hypothetical protein
MADPYANYLANISPFAGPGLAPYGMTREQAALFGMPKAPEAMDPGLSYLGGGIAGQMGLESLQNMADLGQGIDPSYNSAGMDVGPKAAQALGAVGNAAMRGMAFAPKGSAGSFGGHLAEGWSPAAAEKYRDMLREGYTPQDATKETGMFRTADRMLKFEIPDTGSSLTNTAVNSLVRYGPGTKLQGRLSDFLNHPELYENYPGMRGLPTTIELRAPRASGDMNYEGMYSPSTGSVHAASSYFEGPKGIQNVLLHEAGGHHIQQLEGFAKGSSPGYEREVGQNLLDKIIFQKIAEQSKPYPNMDAIARLDAMKRNFSQNFKPYDAYLRSAGEVDARAIQERMMMTPWQLQNISPADTAAGLVPFNRQIVRFNF